MTLSEPLGDELIAYKRNIMFCDDDMEYVLFVHRMKAYAQTSVHNHSESTNVFVLPLTDGLVEESFLGNSTSYVTNSKVSLTSHSGK